MEFSFGVTSILALWGACLSTVLGGIKIWDFLQNRTRFETSYIFRSHEREGNDVVLRNPTSRKIFVTDWYLAWGQKHLFKFEELERVAPDWEDEFHTLQLDPLHEKRLHFSDERYFSTSSKRIPSKASLYFVLEVLGTKKRFFVKVA